MRIRNGARLPVAAMRHNPGPARITGARTAACQARRDLRALRCPRGCVGGTRRPRAGRIAPGLPAAGPGKTDDPSRHGVHTCSPHFDRAGARLRSGKSGRSFRALRHLQARLVPASRKTHAPRAGRRDTRRCLAAAAARRTPSARATRSRLHRKNPRTWRHRTGCAAQTRASDRCAAAAPCTRACLTRRPSRAQRFFAASPRDETPSKRTIRQSHTFERVRLQPPTKHYKTRSELSIRRNPDGGQEEPPRF